MTEFTTWRSLVDGAEISAIPDGVVLRPESDDLDHFSGDTGSWSINDEAPVFDDELSLKADEDDSSTLSMVSTSGLDNYPEIGKKHVFFVYYESNYQMVSFGTDNAPNENDGYGYDLRDGELELTRWDDGSRTTLETGASLPEDEWISLETLHESNGDWTLIAREADDVGLSEYENGDEIDSLETTDDTYITDGEYDNQGIGFLQTNAEVMVLDSWLTD